MIQRKVNFRKLCFQKTPTGYKATLVSPNFCTQGSGRQLEGFLIFLSYYLCICSHLQSPKTTQVVENVY